MGRHMVNGLGEPRGISATPDISAAPRALSSVLSFCPFSARCAGCRFGSLSRPCRVCRTASSTKARLRAPNENLRGVSNLDIVPHNPTPLPHASGEAGLGACPGGRRHPLAQCTAAGPHWPANCETHRGQHAKIPAARLQAGKQGGSTICERF